MPIHHPPSRRGGRTGSPRGELSPQATEGCALSPPSPEGGERAASGSRRGSPLRESLNPCRPEQACCRAQRICDLNDRRGRSYDSYAPKDLRTSWKRTDPSTAGSALRSGRRILDHPQRAAPAGAFRSMTERSEALSAEMIPQFCILHSKKLQRPLLIHAPDLPRAFRLPKKQSRQRPFHLFLHQFPELSCPGLFAAPAAELMGQLLRQL